MILFERILLFFHVFLIIYYILVCKIGRFFNRRNIIISIYSTATGLKVLSLRQSIFFLFKNKNKLNKKYFLLIGRQIKFYLLILLKM